MTNYFGFCVGSPLDVQSKALKQNQLRTTDLEYYRRHQSELCNKNFDSIIPLFVKTLWRIKPEYIEMALMHITAIIQIRMGTLQETQDVS